MDASKVMLTGQGAEVARATVETEFIVDGRKAGPGGCFVVVFFISLWLKTSIGLTGYIGCSGSESSVISMIIHIGSFGVYTAAKLPISKRVCLSDCLLFVCLSVL